MNKEMRGCRLFCIPLSPSVSPYLPDAGKAIRRSSAQIQSRRLHLPPSPYLPPYPPYLLAKFTGYAADTRVEIMHRRYNLLT